MNQTVLRSTAAAIVMAGALFAGHAATIHVDRANTGGPWDGTSWPTAWTNFAAALSDLSARNLAGMGGHTVWVNAGVYTDGMTLTTNHSGVAGNPNLFVTNGVVVISNSYPFTVSAGHIIIDGFWTKRNDLGAISVYSTCSNSIIRNCIMTHFEPKYGEVRVAGIYFYSPGPDNLFSNCLVYGQASGVDFARSSSQITFANCVFMNNVASAFRFRNDSLVAARVTLRNSILAGNGGFAIQMDGSKAWMRAVNNCFFANGSGQIWFSMTNMYNTAGEINALDNANLVCSNNIVANPGLAALASNWNYFVFYSDSPCLNAGEGGADIGVIQNPPVIPVSAATYYVDKAAGDDHNSGLSPAAAWATLGKAASNAVAGDSVIVKPGVYTEQCIIDRGGSELSPVSYLAESNVFVDGTTWGLKLDRVAGVVVSGFQCTASSHGLWLENSYGNTIRAVRSFSNTVNGVMVTGSPGNTLEELELFGNSSAGVNTAAYYGSGNTLARSRVYGNAIGILLNWCNGGWRIFNSAISSNGIYGIQMYYPRYMGTYRSEMVNCTLWGNRTNGIYIIGDIPLLQNNIIAGPGAGVGVAEMNSASVANQLNNCFFNNATNFFEKGATARQTAAEINSVAGCSNNIVANPALLDPPADWHLRAASPCCDAGRLFPALSEDFYGQGRVRAGQVDIGCAEYWPPSGMVLSSY